MRKTITLILVRSSGAYSPWLIAVKYQVRSQDMQQLHWQYDVRQNSMYNQDLHSTGVEENLQDWLDFSEEDFQQTGQPDHQVQVEADSGVEGPPVLQIPQVGSFSPVTLTLPSSELEVTAYTQIRRTVQSHSCRFCF